MDKYSQNMIISSDKFNEEKKYWMNKLQGEIIGSSFSKGFNNIEENRCANRRVSKVLPMDIFEKINSICNENEMAIYVFLLSGIKLLIFRYTNDENILVGMPNDKNCGGGNLVLNNFIALKTVLKEKDTFRSLVLKVNKTVIEAKKYKNIPISKIAEALKIETESSESWPFNILVLLESLHDEEYIRESDIDIVFNFSIVQGSLTMQIKYNGLLYNEKTMELLLEHLINVYGIVCEEPDRSLTEIDFLSKEEKHKILYTFNNKKENYAIDITINSLFQEQVQKTPQSIAVEYCEKKITYEELNKKANQLARILRTGGIGPNSIVGIMMERSIDVIIGIMAIIKAGGAYMPLDKDYPMERINYMLKDSGADILLTRQEFIKDLDFNGNIIFFDCKIICNEDFSNLQDVNSKEDYVYLIYTSGTTGKPKGVIITHSNFVSASFAWRTEYRLNEFEISLLQVASFSFDVFSGDISRALFNGGKMVICPAEFRYNMPQLYSLLNNQRINIFESVPALILPLMEYVYRNNLDIHNLKLLILGSDSVLRTDFEKLYKRFGSSIRIINSYGVTEATIDSSYFECKSGEIPQSHKLSIGKPLPNTRFYVLDRNRKLQPIGVPGELFISGNGVALGYINRDELTKEKFFMDPFFQGDRMYNTGDQVKWLQDGNIEFLERLDNQIKISGYRIETGEIEAYLMKIQGIKQAVVIPVKSSGESKFLCAYYVAEIQLDESLLRNYLSKQLAYYMIPKYFISLDKMPLNSNGKIDRKSLSKFDVKNYLSTIYVAPSNEIEEKFALIWQEVLCIERVGINDNFFRLGGDSILMIQASVAIRCEMGIEVSLKDFILASTIAQLADRISKRKVKIEKVTYPVIISSKDEKYLPFPLTEIQKSYLIGRLNVFEIGGISTHGYEEIEADLDIERLNFSLNKVIKRHPMLRTIILTSGMQKILKHIPEYKISVEDLSMLNKESQELRIKIERNKMSHFIFKTDEWPLFEVKAFRLYANKYYLCIGADTLIGDDFSSKIVNSEIVRFYNELDLTLPELEFTFRDYVLSYEEFKKSNTYNCDKEYWLEKLEKFPLSPDLPLKKNPVEVMDPHFKRLETKFNIEEFNGLKKLAQDNNITISILLCTVYAEVLAFWSNQPVFTINLTVFNRYPFHKDVDNIVGDFTSLILLDVHFDKIVSFWEKAKLMQENFFEALEHRHFDGVEFIRLLSNYNNLGKKAPMPIVFTSTLLNNVKDQKNESLEFGDVKYSSNQTSQVYIDNQVSEINGELNIVWDYVEELFEVNIIEAIYRHYLDLLKELLVNSTNNILQPNKEDINLVGEINRTDVVFQVSNLHNVFMEQVRKTPNNKAIEFGAKYITYKELNEKSNQVALKLKELGVVAGDYICVEGKRTPFTIINILGILKSGAAYVPIDPDYPEQRKKNIYEEVRCKRILLPNYYNDENLKYYPTDDIGTDSGEQGTAYVLFTSGSTGKPKGVVVSHDAAINTISAINGKFNVTSKDKILWLSSLSFDLSVYDIFGALSVGASIIIISDQKNITEIWQTIEDKEVTIWNSVPSTLELMLENISVNQKNQSIRLVLLSGDWIPLNLPQKTRKYLENPEIISLGGATEATVWSIYHKIIEVKEQWESIPYGTPLANQKIYILNYERELCPVGVTGEIYIGGSSLANGYFNDDLKTKDSFVEDYKFGRLYRTGDYGKLVSEGYIEFLGRKDYQVKISGYRIELGEIEAQLSSYNIIKSASVTDFSESNGKKYLCAYFVSDERLSIAELRQHMANKLPNYMIPSYFIQIDKIPLSINGKVDKSKLPKPDKNIFDRTHYEAPQNCLEEKMIEIWENVLQINGIGTKDNFFEFGGDSIKAIQVLAKLEKYKYKLDIGDIFEYQTIIELSKQVKEFQGESYQGLVVGEVEGTPIHKWFFEQNYTERHHHNLSVMLYNKNSFEEEIIKEVFYKILEHHDALRMIYTTKGSEVKAYNRGLEEKLFTLEVKKIYRTDNQDEIIEAEAEKMGKTIDLQQGPLIRLGLFKTPEGDHLLIIIHQLIIDEVSLRILSEDFTNGYLQALNNTPIKFSDKTDSFQQWAKKITEYAESKELLDEISYWKFIDDFQMKFIDKDYISTECRYKDNNSTELSLSIDETYRLFNDVCHKLNINVRSVLLASLGHAFERIYGMDRVLINIDGHGREEIIKDINIRRTVGCFTSMFPFAVYMEGNKDKLVLVNEIDNSFRKIPNNGIGYGILKYITSCENKKQMNFYNIPEISFNYLGQINEELNNDLFVPSRLSTGSTISPQCEMKYSFITTGMILNKKLKFEFSYNKCLFSHTTVADIVSYCNEFILELIDNIK